MPLLLLTGLIAWVGFQIERDFSTEQRRIFEVGLLASKAKEIESHLNVALSAIEPTLNDSRLSEAAAQEEVKRIINNLRYGKDGYFFLYDRHGVNLVHPAQQNLVGKNLYDKQDSEGRFVIRNLLEVAQKGGGIMHYRWERPSSHLEEEKVGFVQMLPRWGWVLGSGLYDVTAEVETSLKQLQANVHDTFRNILLILAFTISLIVALVFWTNLHESRLASQHLQELAHNFVQLQVEERRHFSRELHEGIPQLMAAAKFRIELALTQINKGSEQYRESLAKALTTLDGAIKEVRGISHALRPALLDEMGLGSALNSLLMQFQERTGITAQRNIELRPQGVPDDAGIMLYRVVQEALTNIERHADAHQVTLRLQQTARHIHLEVSDDGQGFDLAKVAPGRGIGLINMRERVELLGGQFRLDSAPGQGTNIRATLPLSMFKRN